MGRERRRQIGSLRIELHGGNYYVNGHTQFVHLDAALEYAKKKLPNVPRVAIYKARDRRVVYIHVKKPSSVYIVLSERMSPAEAWDLFVGHVGMLQ